MAVILPLSCEKGQGTTGTVVGWKGICGHLDSSAGFGDNTAVLAEVSMPDPYSRLPLDGESRVNPHLHPCPIEGKGKD
jgi:hypothetical protein